jgi:hypothetical protein
MDLHHRLIEQAERHVRAASGIALLLGTLSLLVAFRTWSQRGYIDFQIIFGIADALGVLALGFWLRRRSLIAVVLLIVLGISGIGYGIREGVPLIGAVPTLIALGFYVRALSALRFIGRSAREQRG